MITYTARLLSHALPSAGCDCLGDREEEERNVPAFGVLSKREWSPCVTTALFGIWGVLLSRKADN